MNDNDWVKTNEEPRNINDTTRLNGFQSKIEMFNVKDHFRLPLKK